MKKLLTASLALLLLLSLAACSGLDFNPGGSKNDEDLIYPEDGVAAAYIGETMRTVFFDMTLNSAYTTETFDGLEADDGCKFLVAEITLYNYTAKDWPMYDTDFWVEWDMPDGEDDSDAYAIPLYDMTADGEYVTVSSKQLPVEYELSSKETRTGILLYEVPDYCEDYYLFFEEIFDEDDYGDLFGVIFNAEEGR